MGQVIKELKGLPFLNTTTIEKNDTIYGNEEIVHFHHEGVRYEMSLSDYLTILAGIRISAKNLEAIKNE